ncbi:hypothetical protein L6164_008886 [Bauhinia variegata]|uniref:Uncharacterized protein n=1 Tax=Bauhinia variegata TaxID=167791 RepID=A0ACB9PI01_BAUVA|nr:hypothetical protein L6164_008886 [Bauhinia variegata]
MAFHIICIPPVRIKRENRGVFDAKFEILNDKKVDWVGKGEVQHYTVLAKQWQRSKSDVNDPHFSHLPHKQPAVVCSGAPRVRILQVCLLKGDTSLWMDVLYGKDIRRICYMAWVMRLANYIDSASSDPGTGILTSV